MIMLGGVFLPPATNQMPAHKNNQTKTYEYVHTHAHMGVHNGRALCHHNKANWLKAEPILR